MSIKLTNVHFSGGHTGIKSIGPVDIEAENVTFDNVQAPYDIAGAKSVSINGSRIKNDPKARQTKTGAGWTRPNGPPLPVLCPSCKSIFASRNYNFGGAYFNAWDNEETCAECGSEHARLSEGLFDLAGETVRVLNAPDITYAMLKAISGIAEAVAEGKIPVESAIAKYSTINPGIGRLARMAMKYGHSALFLFSAVAGILAAYWAYQQVQLGEEQVRLQREANASSDLALERTLAAIRNLKFTSEGIYQNQGAPDGQALSVGPTQHKTATEGATRKLKADRRSQVVKPAHVKRKGRSRSHL